MFSSVHSIGDELVVTQLTVLLRKALDRKQLQWVGCHWGRKGPAG